MADANITPDTIGGEFTLSIAYLPQPVITSQQGGRISQGSWVGSGAAIAVDSVFTDNGSATGPEGTWPGTTWSEALKQDPYGGSQYRNDFAPGSCEPVVGAENLFVTSANPPSPFPLSSTAYFDNTWNAGVAGPEASFVRSYTDWGVITNQPGTSPVTHAGNGATASASATSVTVTLPEAISAGDLICCYITTGQQVFAASQLTDTAGNTYTAGGRTVSGGSLAWCLNAKAAPSGVTITLAGPAGPLFLAADHFTGGYGFAYLAGSAAIHGAGGSSGDCGISTGVPEYALVYGGGYAGTGNLTFQPVASNGVPAGGQSASSTAGSGFTVFVASAAGGAESLTWTASGQITQSGSAGQAVFTCRYSDLGSVKTYPANQVTFAAPLPPVSSFQSIWSYANAISPLPPAAAYPDVVYEAAWDIYGQAHTDRAGITLEVMFWTYNHNQSPGSIGPMAESGIDLNGDGKLWDLYMTPDTAATGGVTDSYSYFIWYLQDAYQESAGWVNILAGLRYVLQYYVVPSGPGAPADPLDVPLMQITRGWEMCSTQYAPVEFRLADYRLAME